MRSTYLVCYDICDDKRLRKVFRTLRNWGDHLQFSIFECSLNPVELLQCKSELSDIINYGHDQVLFVYLGPTSGRAERSIEALGIPYSNINAPCLIV